MYARTVKGKTLTLIVSGMLWEMSLVMMDVETKSLWSHLLGEAMKGELVGEKLEVIPSYMTDWKSWKDSHPQTTCVVMSHTSESFKRKMIQDGATGSSFMIGVTTADASRGWRLSELRSQNVVNDLFDEEPVVAVYDDANGTAVVYGRTVDEQQLSFDWKEGKLIDRETESEWELLTGAAVSGPLAGKSLGPQRGIFSFSHAWVSFHPESTYWSSEKESPAKEAEASKK